VTNHHYVKDDQILASSPPSILTHIEQDFQTRFSRDFFGLPTGEKQAFNVFEESVSGAYVEDDFNEATDSGPSWNGTAVVRTLGSQPRSLDDAKTRLKSRLTSKFIQNRDKGVEVTLGLETATIDTSMDAQQEVSALVNRLERVGGTQTIRTRSGSILTVDLSMAQVLFNAVEDHVAGAWTNDAVLGAAIDAAIDIGQLQVIDLDDGWPGE